MDKLENLIAPDWVLPLLVGCFATLAVRFIWDLMRNRRSLLTYHVTHDRIGISTYDNIHGEVSVTVGGTQMQNLYLSNVWLVNRSLRDVEKLEIKVWTGNEQTCLMTESTYIEGIVEFLKHTLEYEKIKKELQNSIAQKTRAQDAGDYGALAQISQDQANNWKIWSKQRWYEVPVLARGQALRFTYMTNVLSNVDPVIHISCQKAGVRVKYKQLYQPVWDIWGVPLVEAGLTGVAIGLIVWLVIINFVSILWIAALLCLVVGFLSNLPGAIVVKFFRWFRDELIG